MRSGEWELSDGLNTVWRIDHPIGFDSKRLFDFCKRMDREIEHKVERYYGSKIHIVVPEKIAGYLVRGVGSDAFKNIQETDNHIDAYPCKTLQDIHFPDGIEYIENGAFAGFTKLLEVILPDSISYIGEDCFSYTGIRRIRFPKNASYVAQFCFCGCERLQEVILQDGIEHIGMAAFRDCTSLKTIVIPSTVKHIHRGAFMDSGLQRIVLPEGVERVQREAFCNCRDLKSCMIPASVSEIDDTAFSWCDDLNVSPAKYYNNPNLTLYVYPGSYGLMWAREHGYRVASAVL